MRLKGSPRTDVPLQSRYVAFIRRKNSVGLSRAQIVTRYRSSTFLGIFGMTHRGRVVDLEPRGRLIKRDLGSRDLNPAVDPIEQKVRKESRPRTRLFKRGRRGKLTEGMRRDGALFCLSRAEAKNPRADPRSSPGYIAHPHCSPRDNRDRRIFLDSPGRVFLDSPGQAPASSGQLRTDRKKFAEITLIVGRPSARFEDHRPAVFLPDHRGTRACALPRFCLARSGGAVVATRDIQTREKCTRSRIFVILHISISVLVTRRDKRLIKLVKK